MAPEFENSSTAGSAVFPPSSLSLHEHRTRHDSGTRSDTRFLLILFSNYSNFYKKIVLVGLVLVI